MEKKNFPWLKAVPNPEESDPKTKTPEPMPPKFLGFDALKKSLPYGLFFLVIVLLFVFRKSGAEHDQPDQNRYLDVLVVMLPTPKGSPLLPATLKQIPMDRKTFSKTQILQVVHLEDLVKVQNKVRAKKDLPPNKALFWSDLELKNPIPTHELSTIYFSKE